MSVHPVIWSPKAQSEFVEILEFIELQFGSEIAADCALLVEAMTEKISHFPNMFPAYGHHQIRKMVVQKNLTIFYRFQRDQIDILKVWNSRQNPDDLRL